MSNLVEKPEGYFEISPRPSSEELAAYYRDKYFGSRDGRTPYAHGYTPEELAHKRLQPAETERVWGKAPGRMLEVGVGEGFSLEYFLARGWDARGLDFTDDGVREFFPHLSERLVLGDAFTLLDQVIAGGETFDLVICNNVLEHVIDPMGLLDRLKAIVAPGGLARIADDVAQRIDAVVAAPVGNEHGARIGDAAEARRVAARRAVEPLGADGGDDDER